jgi:uncharacterized protein
MTIKIGVISDTHGLLRNGVQEYFKGCRYIIHAGDICSMNIPVELATIAETIAIQGNMDRTEFPRWADTLDYKKELDVGKIKIIVAHEPEKAMDIYEKITANNNTVILINGHTHLPNLEWRKNLIRLNPGAAGNTNLRTEPTIALIEINDEVEKICFKTLGF